MVLIKTRLKKNTNFPIDVLLYLLHFITQITHQATLLIEGLHFGS